MQKPNDERSPIETKHQTHAARVRLGLIALSIILINCAQTKDYPIELMKSYSCLRDMSTSLEKKNKEIAFYNRRIKDEKNVDLKNTWNQMLIYEKSFYNKRASEYNYQMMDLDFIFCDHNNLPFVGDSPLPRKYNLYFEALK